MFMGLNFWAWIVIRPILRTGLWPTILDVWVNCYRLNPRTSALSVEPMSGQCSSPKKTNCYFSEIEKENNEKRIRTFRRQKRVSWRSSRRWRFKKGGVIYKWRRRVFERQWLCKGTAFYEYLVIWCTHTVKRLRLSTVTVVTGIAT